MEAFTRLRCGVTICYDTFGSSEGVPLLLIMGLGTQMIGWPDAFCEQLADRGFWVIRYDNRDCGRSSSISGRAPTLRELLLRRIDDPPYTLSEMADDAVGLLRNLDVSSAHVVGASMGGMIGQTLAIQHPEFVASLVSIMATTGENGKGGQAFRVLRYFLRRAPTERKAFVSYMTHLHGVIGSNGVYVDRSRVREMLESSYDRGLNPSGTGRQLGAIIASGDRTRSLRELTVPTVVIHGSEDPLVNVSGGQATAQAIPGSKLLVIDGMGHDLPEGAWPQIIDVVTEHTNTAERDGHQHAVR